MDELQPSSNRKPNSQSGESLVRLDRQVLSSASIVELVFVTFHSAIVHLDSFRVYPVGVPNICYSYLVCFSLSQVELASHDESSHGDRTQGTGVGPERTGAKKLNAYDFK